jgi:hypothetical protein
MITLPTWGGKSEFQYSGSVKQGTQISWKDKAKPGGFSRPLFVSPAQYQSLRSTFSGKEVPLGNYRDPAQGTLEAWLKKQPDQWGVGLARHLGKILVVERYAEPSSRRGRILINPINS